MAEYDDPQDVSMPSLAEMDARMRKRRAMMEAQKGAGPSVGLAGIGKPQIMPRQSDVTLPPMRVQVPAQAPAGPAMGQQMNPQAAMDPRAARLRALMGQGHTFEQAMRKIQQGG